MARTLDQIISSEKPPVIAQAKRNASKTLWNIRRTMSDQSSGIQQAGEVEQSKLQHSDKDQ
ncbi:hypothetical protein [Oceanospirillum sediminis]|uniref:Uncharacterized protein n=1 Tax=Oceanospirillum sediminis TaxID=2760088 RepID=A0A839IW52_9GAMM|nr:hypothetical protein [Oceanospirillum sediminis]MBB1489595.1 hypothetical protein [Oceanospirillum sediminis]